MNLSRDICCTSIKTCRYLSKYSIENLLPVQQFWLNTKLEEDHLSKIPHCLLTMKKDRKYMLLCTY